MKLFFEKVRTPKKDMSLKIQIMVTIGIIVFGFALGVFQLCHILGNENSDLLLNFIFKLYQVAASATARPSYVKITTFLKR